MRAIGTVATGALAMLTAADRFHLADNIRSVPSPLPIGSRRRQTGTTASADEHRDAAVPTATGRPGGHLVAADRRPQVAVVVAGIGDRRRDTSVLWWRVVRLERSAE